MSKKIQDAIEFLKTQGYLVIDADSEDRPLAARNAELLEKIKELAEYRRQYGRIRTK